MLRHQYKQWMVYLVLQSVNEYIYCTILKLKFTFEIISIYIKMKPILIINLPLLPQLLERHIHSFRMPLLQRMMLVDQNVGNCLKQNKCFQYQSTPLHPIEREKIHDIQNIDRYQSLNTKQVFSSRINHSFFTFGIAFSSSLRAWRGDRGPPPYALLGEPSPVDTDKEFSSMMQKIQLFINILTRFWGQNRIKLQRKSIRTLTIFPIFFFLFR